MSTVKAKSAKRNVKKAQVKDTQVEEKPVEATPVEELVSPGGTRTRREVNPDTVDATFTELCGLLQEEIERQREVKGNVKFLRSTLKSTKQLQNDVRRVARKKRAPRAGNGNSGFLKEAKISNAMADFLGLEHGSSISRVECTRGLQKYILEHNLQNPDNRREIRPDKNLTRLLKYNKKSVEDGGHGPLYYYVMQKLIQQHFV